MKTKIISSIIVLSSICATAKPASKIDGDRPEYTRSPDPVYLDSFQIESGYTYNQTNVIKEHIAGEMNLRISVIKDSEFRVGFNSFVFLNSSKNNSDDKNGKDPGYLGLKIRLIRPTSSISWSPTISIMAGTSIPAGTSTVGHNTYEPEGRIIMFFPVVKLLRINTNFIYRNMEEKSTRYNQWSGTVSLKFNPHDVFGVFTEYYGMYPLKLDGAYSSYAAAGITLTVMDELQLDCRAGKNIQQGGYFIGGGVSTFFN